jgi:hypothetical protein
LKAVARLLNPEFAASTSRRSSRKGVNAVARRLIPVCWTIRFGSTGFLVRLLTVILGAEDAGGAYLVVDRTMNPSILRMSSQVKRFVEG